MKIKNSHLSTVSFSVVLIALVAIVAACGGGGGSGARTSIEGNIVEPLVALRQRKTSAFSEIASWFRLVNTASATVSGVQVVVRDTGLSTVSDDSGFFRLEGEFSERIVIDFVLPEGTASLGISVPAGTTVILQDVSLNISTGEAAAAQTVIMDNSPSSPSGNDSSQGNSNTGDDSNTNTDDDNGTNNNSDDVNDNDDNDDNGNENTDSNDNNDDDENNNEDRDDDNQNDDGRDDNSDDDDDDRSGSNSGRGRLESGLSVIY